MPDPARLEYFGLPGYAWLWLLTLVSFSVFGQRVLHHIQVLAHARPEKRWDQVGRRLGLVLGQVLGERRLLDEPVIGTAHLVIFWSFALYATTFFWNLLRGLVPIRSVPYPDQVPGIAFALEALGALAVVALAVAAVRRYVFTPVSLERTWDASVILLLIGLVVLSFLAGAGFQALAAPAEQTWRPLARFMGGIFAALGLSWARAPAWYLGAWWLHMVTVLGFLAYLPYSKHLHLLASPFSVFFASLEPSRMPAASEGAGRREEFTWRQLFSGLACAECGRCDRVCPAFASGSALSPKKLIHAIKELVLAPGNGQAILGDKVRAEEVWACTTCAACMERCPVFNEHIPLLIEMRRQLVSRGRGDRSGSRRR